MGCHEQLRMLAFKRLHMPPTALMRCTWKMRSTPLKCTLHFSYNKLHSALMRYTWKMRFTQLKCTLYCSIQQVAQCTDALHLEDGLYSTEVH